MLARLQAPAAIRAEAGKAVRPRAKALRGVRTDLPRRLFAQPDLEPLVAPLGAPGQVDPRGERIAEIDVQPDLRLPVEARVERRGRGRTERSVDGIVDEEIGLAGAGAGARVPEHAAGELPAHTGYQRRVAHVAPELRREAARKALLEGEAGRIGEDPRQGGRFGPAGGNRHGGAGGRPVGHAVLHVEHVADEQAPTAIGAENGGPRIRIPEEEAAGHPPAGVVGVAVGLHAGGEEVAEVAPQLDVVVDPGRAPDLRGIGHGVVARGDQQRGVVTLDAAAGRSGVAVLEAEVGEAGPAERQAGVGGDGVRAAVARAVAAGVQLDAAAGPVVLEQEVQHAGDGVRAVLCGCAVAQHFHLSQGDRRDGGAVRPLRTVRHAVDPGNDRRAVAALAVHQHQRMVMREIAQAGRPHERGRVADRMRGDVERGDQGPQLVVERGGALADNILERDGVDRHRRLGHRSRLRATADDDHLLLELHRHLDIERDRGPDADRHALAHDRGKAGQGERHVVRAGLKRSDGERASAIGEDGSDLTAGHVARGHGDTGQNEARRVGDPAFDGCVLGAGDARRKHKKGEDRAGDGGHLSQVFHRWPFVR